MRHARLPKYRKLTFYQVTNVLTLEAIKSFAV